MIDDMEGKMDQIHERLVKETKRVRFIDRKSSTCGINTNYFFYEMKTFILLKSTKKSECNVPKSGMQKNVVKILQIFYLETFL